MAEEPQPSQPGPVPSAAEKQREEAALSNLSSQNITSDDAEGSGSAAAATDTAALGAAVSNLAISGQDGARDGAGAGSAASAASKVSGAPKAEAKKVKIDQSDVSFLVQELEVSKKKAGEMLQASGGDRAAAVHTFISPVKI